MRAKLRRSRARQILGCASSVELRAERPAILGNRLSGVAVKLAGFGDIFFLPRRHFRGIRSAGYPARAKIFSGNLVLGLPVFFAYSGFHLYRSFALCSICRLPLATFATLGLRRQLILLRSGLNAIRTIRRICFLKLHTGLLRPTVQSAGKRSYRSA